MMSTHDRPPLGIAKFSGGGLLVWIAALLAAWMPTEAHAGYRSFVGSSPAVFVGYLTIPQSSSVVLNTSALSTGADPILYLLRQNTDGSYTQVAYNDDFAPPNRNAQITYTNSGSVTTFVVLLRAYSESSTGTGLLSKNGTAWHSAPIGGWFQAASLFTFGSGYQVRTGHVPGGSVAPMVVKFSSSSQIAGMAIGNAVAGASVLSLSGSESHFLFGTPQVLDGTTYTTLRSGPATIFMNDVQSDTDGDGVGNLLEGEIGTCATVSGCGFNAYHGRDTDRDGLSDAEELWGLVGTLPSGLDDLALPRWGALPRRKDVFLEVDWLTSMLSGANPFQVIRDTGTLGGWKDTLEQWVDYGRLPFSFGPAGELKNPEGTTGVRLHLDLGVQPLYIGDEDKFGAWPTGAARGVVPDFIMRFTGAINGPVEVKINGQVSSFDATGLTRGEIGAAAAFAALFTGQPVSVKSYSVDGSGNATTVIEATNAGQHFSRELTVPAGFASAAQMPGESPESLRKHYFDPDPDQVDAIRRGVVRYAVATSAGTGGNADGAAFVAGLAHSSFFHELGHSLGLAHSGHSAWGNGDIECLPHYMSLMRYGYGPYQFTSGSVGVAINPAATVETGTLGAGFDHSLYLSSPYVYQLPTASAGVDWNRDGVLSPASSAWRSFAIAIAGGSCKAFAQGEQELASSEAVEGSPDLVRFGNRLYAFWITGSPNQSIKYRHAQLGMSGNKSCSGSSNPANAGSSPCLSWSATQTLASGGSFKGVTAYAHAGQLMIATQAGDGSLVVRHCSADGAGSLSAIATYPLSGSPTDQHRTNFTPELVERHQGVHSRTLGLLYLAQDNTFRSFGWTGSAWQAEGAMLNLSGNAIGGTQGIAAKAWPDAAVTGWSANERKTIALLPLAGGSVRVYGLDYSTNRWFDLDVDTSGPNDTITTGKPFVEFRSARSTAGVPDANFSGNFLFGWGNANGGNTSDVRTEVQVSTPVSRANPPWSGTTSNLEATPYIDYLVNQWARIQDNTSTVLYSDSTLDNVFGLTALGVGGSNRVVFYPHADASPDRSLSVYSDFMVMEDYLCTTLGYWRGYSCGAIDIWN